MRLRRASNGRASVRGLLLVRAGARLRQTISIISATSRSSRMGDSLQRYGSSGVWVRGDRTLMIGWGPRRLGPDPLCTTRSGNGQPSGVRRSMGPPGAGGVPPGAGRGRSILGAARRCSVSAPDDRKARAGRAWPARSAPWSRITSRGRGAARLTTFSNKQDNSEKGGPLPMAVGVRTTASRRDEHPGAAAGSCVRGSSAAASTVSTVPGAKQPVLGRGSGSVCPQPPRCRLRLIGGLVETVDDHLRRPLAPGGTPNAVRGL